MKKNMIIILTIILITALNASASVTQVPDIISAPVVLYDEGNNLLGDGDYTLTIAFKDKSGTYLYTEEQNVSVKNGVAHIVLGAGYAVGSAFASPAGGLSYDVFNVDGDVMVEVLVEGQTNPQEISILATQPYAFISQYAVTVANDSITSNKIKDGTIRAEDLDATFLEGLISQDKSIVSSASSQASAPEGYVSANEVSVSSDIGLNNASGNTVYKVLQGLDNAIDTLRGVDLNQSLNDINTNVEEVSANLIKEIETVSTNLSTNYIKKDGSNPMTADLKMGGKNIINVGTVDGVDVSDLKDDVGTVKTRVSTLETSVGNLDSTYATDTQLSSAVTELNTTIEGVQSDVTAIDGRVFAIEAKSLSENDIPIMSRPITYGYMQSEDGCSGMQLIQGYNVESINPMQSRIDFRLKTPLSQPGKLIIITDDVSNPTQQPDRDHRCIRGQGIYTAKYAGQQGFTLAYCSIAAVCNDISPRALSFMVYFIPN
ncbi:MAG: hypothetical protein HQM16_18860 [Deltaproteobacteria bacterium]|nr:hypothetical protein [Deltaproteobacteria bacterium]